MYRARRRPLFLEDTREEGIMNDITFAASRIAGHRSDELERAAAQRRAIADRTAACALPPVREHPRVRFPRLQLPGLFHPHISRPAI
jgi:hypothetical protein